jgi:hypothetical protein
MVILGVVPKCVRAGGRYYLHSMDYFEQTLALCQVGLTASRQTSRPMLEIGKGGWFAS